MKPALNAIATAEMSARDLERRARKAKRKGKMFRVCAYCVPANRSTRRMRNLSHGICDACLHEQMESLEEIEDSTFQIPEASWIAAGLFAALSLSGCSSSDPGAPILALLLLVAITSALGVVRIRRRERRLEQKPWSLSREQLARGFDSIREGIPVDDYELAQAKPIGPRWKKHERQKRALLSDANFSAPTGDHQQGSIDPLNERPGSVTTPATTKPRN